MKKNGFTLIELLAVIVVLAIIALIATPIVLNIINNAKTSSNERSGELYIKAVENAIMKKQMNGTDVVTSGTYTVQSDGSICILSNNVCTDGTTITIDVDGDIPAVGSTLTIDTKGVVTAYTLVVSGTSVTKGENSDNGSTTKVYENGEAVYFNVTTGVKCSETDAVSTTGTKEGCMKFYAFNDEGETSTTINLILDHNTTGTVAWNLSGSNSSGPSDVLTQLASDTVNWTGVETPENYTNSHYGYTVDYKNYGGKARLITANEIAKITGNTSWDESDTSANFYLLDSKDQDVSKAYKDQGTSAYAWLFNYTGYTNVEVDCTNFGCTVGDGSVSGYWTVSANSFSSGAWYIEYFGAVGNDISDCDDVFCVDCYGLRPVITVEKSKLN